MFRKKTFIKINALLLAFIMMFGTLMTMAPTVLAATTIDTSQKGSLTIYKLESASIDETTYSGLTSAEKANYHEVSDDGGTAVYHKYIEGAEYTIYRIGDIVQETDISGNVTIKYVDVQDATNEIDLTDTSSIVSNLNGSLASYIKNSETTNSTGKLNFTNLTLGLYYVEETGVPSGYGNANNFFVQIPMTDVDSNDEQTWNYNVVAYPKNSTIGDIDKEVDTDTVTSVTDTSSGNTVNTTQLGATIGYTLTIITPADLVDASGNCNYDEYLIVDKASKYLTVDTNNIKIYYYDPSNPNIEVILNPGEYAVTQELVSDGSSIDDFNYTIIEIDESILKAIGNSNTIYIEYLATVSSNVAASDVITIENEAYIEYTTDGGTQGKTTPSTEEVKLYSYTAQKIDENGDPLKGAVFVLSHEVDDGTGTTVMKYLAYDDQTGWCDVDDIGDASTAESSDGTNTYAEGVFGFRGLPEGTYYLTEITAPNGYTLLSDTIKITINAASTQTASLSHKVTGSNQYDDYTIQIINEKNSDIELPTTGGAGIYMFIIVGAILMAIAAVLFVKLTKKN